MATITTIFVHQCALWLGEGPSACCFYIRLSCAVLSEMGSSQ